MIAEHPSERAILVHLDGYAPEVREDPYEFQELVVSAGAVIASFVNVPGHQPTARFLIGSGKVEELRQLVLTEQADLVIFNHALTASQERNLENALDCRVLDRVGLILDIFAQRAQTYEGKLQVELAQLEHLSTRLVRSRTDLSRQQGGIGLRGPGETQLESDRRLIRSRVRQIKSRLEKVRNQRQLARRSRQRADMPGVSLVGYTNTGKSTLFNLLTESRVYAADQLFATLDPTVRRIEVPELGAVTLADTVGFIRHLPHKLVDAFRATLEESANADLLLHMIDAQSPERDEQIKQVQSVLEDIDAEDVRVLEVYNKIDLLDNVEPHIQRNEQGEPIRVWISSERQLGIDLLLQAVAQLLEEEIYVATVRLGQQQSRLRGKLFDLNAVQQETHTEEGDSLLQLRVAKIELDRLLNHEGILVADFFEQYTEH